MKKEFSFYEFAGIIVPSVILLFFTELLLELGYAKTIIDFSSIGETLVFFIVAYGIGHIMQAFGNMFEWVVWKLYGGMPSSWLTKNPRFKQALFDDVQTNKIKGKLFEKFGETPGKDYGRDTYNFLSIKQMTARTDIFNGNYSLFRGLAVSFFIISILAIKVIGWKYSIIPISFFVLATIRMIRFAKLYAREIYRTFYNLSIN